jgi:hypothetical protein
MDTFLREHAPLVVAATGNETASSK